MWRRHANLVTMIGPLNTAFSLCFTAFMSVAAIVSSLLDKSGQMTRRFATFWGTRLCRFCDIEVTVRGGSAVAWDKPLIVMANHQSFLDIPVLYAALPVPFGMLAKKELFRLPIFNSAMRALRCVPIDRGSRRQSFESLRRAAEMVQGGNSIVVFPEGTRSADGAIHHLKKGPFYLAELAGVPVVPVAIRGTSHSLPKNGVLVRRGRVEVSIGAPLMPEKDGQNARQRLRDEVHAALVELSGLPAAEEASPDSDAPASDMA
jgi:1-acyl-sn-glycerol-3-phosphate acyltransferase